MRESNNKKSIKNRFIDAKRSLMMSFNNYINGRLLIINNKIEDSSSKRMDATIAKKNAKDKELQNSINSLIMNTNFVLKELFVDDQHFGNMIVVFIYNNHLIRIIQDRSEIHFDKSIGEGRGWSEYEKCDLFNAYQYEDGERLIEAVKFMISNQ